MKEFLENFKKRSESKLAQIYIKKATNDHISRLILHDIIMASCECNYGVKSVHINLEKSEVIIDGERVCIKIGKELNDV